MIVKLDQAHALLNNGQIIAYPTEAVYGLGCNIFSRQAVLRILKLKQRQPTKGLIVLVHSYEALTPLITPLADADNKILQQHWPGPTTFLIPKSSFVPEWICGNNPCVAVRMSAHPVAKALCRFGPIVSTSANISGHIPAKTAKEVRLQFSQQPPIAIVEGNLGEQNRPSQIIDLKTMKALRI
jgi:L-threonylcarbamoyladenylate synthase